ncbi:MAG: hypothetical protein AMXMBFR47_17680 [Planctomycetota bacterium]
MLKTFSPVVTIALAVVLPSIVAGQVTGNRPRITITRWDVQRLGVTTTLYNRTGPVGSLAAIPAFQHMELDRVTVSFEVTDPDWIQPITVDPQTGEVNNPNEPVFLRYDIVPIESASPPEAPPILYQPLGWFPDEEGFRPIPGPTTPYIFTPDPFTFTISDINGRSQRRLLGLQDYDVQYFLQFCAANDPDTDPQPAFIGCTSLVIKVIENPALRPGSPRVFADAGADQTVARGATVELDAGRTFNSYNVGFDPANPFVIEQSRIEFGWEWLSGPVRVDPVQPSGNSPIATVQVTVSGDYEFRVTADALESAGPPSTDVVRITVLDALPPQNPPTAVIIGPANAVIVGQTITLDGSTSSDPENDPLTFRWRQTNALGQPLTGEQLLTGFQALSGVDTNKSTWQAVTPGTFYFRLLVSDAQFTSVATFSIRVIENSTGGANAIAESPEADSAVEDSAVQVAPIGLCGAGLAPLSLLPLALLALKRRR